MKVHAQSHRNEHLLNTRCKLDTHKSNIIDNVQHYTNDARLQVERSNMLSRAWHVITRAQPQVMTFQPRDNIFECSTSKRASSVLSCDQLRASIKSRWIIYLRLCFTPQKHQSSLCVTV